MDQCKNVRIELNSIKNLAFKARRTMISDIRSVKDTLRNSLKKSGVSAVSVTTLDESNKENNMNCCNKQDKFDKIEVKLNRDNSCKRKSVLEKKGKLEKTESNLSSKLLLDIQELRFMEQRCNLISKKNEGIRNYYSENKSKLVEHSKV